MRIEDAFREYFRPWDIELPPEDVAKRRPGRITQKGWMIWYLFDVGKNCEYLDFYATHRMTDDRHVRIYETGEVDRSLPRIESMRRCSENPEEDKQLEKDFLARNQEVERMLESKGFGLRGDELPAAQMNRYLRTRERKGDESQ